MSGNRASWDEYFMQMAYHVASRSTCIRRKVGCVIVNKNRHILATGYNGVPAGFPHCTDVGCLRQKMGIPSGQRHEICRGVHAEQNAIIQAAVHGISIEGATVYCTTCPCAACAKMLISCRITFLLVAEDYSDDLAHEMLMQSGVLVRRLGNIA